jgi:hypothetical protein
MKKQILILVALSGLLNFSCDNNNGNNESVQLEYVCNCKQIEKVSDFIEKSIKNANNMSDEEMEDVIEELHRTAVKVNCDRKNIKAVREAGSIKILTGKLDSCERIMSNIY